MQTQVAPLTERHHRVPHEELEQALVPHCQWPVVQVLPDPRVLDSLAALVLPHTLEKRVRTLEHVVEKLRQWVGSPKVDPKLQPFVRRTVDHVHHVR